MKYKTTLSNGHVMETNSPHEAHNFIPYDDDQKFSVAGATVSRAEFFQATEAARQVAFDKKNKTHKQVRVLYGSSVASYVTKWVAR